ncbi:MAG: DUF2634 domain-containing protein [Eubacteriales bacterium]|nr:DUF2634 domain-containing protein [Eubacteriales bacterium]MDD4390325.1 DUF2634 domain-containing protein [Eubacteriales bacterium]
MFPETDIQVGINPEETATLGKSFSFDFGKGDFATVDGRLIQASGIDALKVWIEKVIKTEKYKFKIYNTGDTEQYGITLIDFVTKGYPQAFVEIELKREIEEALLRNPEIVSVENFGFSRDKRTLDCSFAASTIYGETIESEVFI